MFQIETKRLRLIPLNLENLLLLKENRALMEKNLQLNISQMVMEEHILAEIAEALDFWISRVRENEENYPWFTTWEMVLKDKNLSIGGIGLTGLPDSKGELIVGYGLDTTYHNQGFATEALQGIVNWVFQNPNVERMVAETERENYPSHQVLKKNGFVQTDVRGELLIWKLPRAIVRMNQEIINEAICQKN